MGISIIGFFVCVMSTIIGAVSGMGGGIIIKPVMDAISGLPVATIGFLSGCTVLAMCTVSFWKSRKGNVSIEGRRGTALAIGAALGGVFGKIIFDVMKAAINADHVIGAIQALILFGLTMIVYIYMKKKDNITVYHVQNIGACMGVGMILGVVGAFLGIGGGPFNLAILMWLFGMDNKTGVIHSLYIVFLSQLASLITTVLRGNIPIIDPMILVAMVIGGIAGGYIGSCISIRLTHNQVDRVFVWALWLVSAVCVYNFCKYVFF